MGIPSREPSQLRLTNTLTRRKEPFASRLTGKVKMFTCGPSIYSRPHVGNYRTFLFEDVLQRYLEYSGYEVHRVINFTDVEDKAIVQAKQEGKSLRQLTDPVADRFFREARALHIKLPPLIPRSSTSVRQAVELIKVLLKKGYAYWHGKDVFYDPLKFTSFGKLFGLDMSRWPHKKVRFRKDTYMGQRWNLGDFILWHGPRNDPDGNFTWDTDIGWGRPSWNIQDPAMITKHLGYEIDIACGGVDNLYRHHDYTIAVVESISGKNLSNYWLHGEHVLVGGSKMSKSKGNIVYLEDLFQQGYTPRHIRFFLTYSHYRKKVNLTPKNLERASRRLDGFREVIRGITGEGATAAHSSAEAESHVVGLIRDFQERMDDDLDVRGALDSLEQRLRRLAALRQGNQLSRQHVKRVGLSLRKVDQVLQVLHNPGK